jgi:hypothetical protein
MLTTNQVLAHIIEKVTLITITGTLGFYFASEVQGLTIFGDPIQLEILTDALRVR